MIIMKWLITISFIILYKFLFIIEVDGVSSTIDSEKLFMTIKDAQEGSKSKQHEDLVIAAEKSSGVYSSLSLRKQHQELNNIIIVTVANYPYMNQLTNFACWLERLNMKALLFSLDEKLHQHITQLYKITEVEETLDTHNNSKNKRFHTADPLLQSYHWKQDQSLSTYGEYHTKQFHSITTSKLGIILVLLHLKYSVLFVDADVALIRNPFPYLLWNNVDYVHSINKICPDSDTFDVYKDNDEGNTGFHFIKSSKITIKLFELVVKDIPNWPNIDDQNIFWRFIKNHKKLTLLHAPRVVALSSCRHFDYKGLIKTYYNNHIYDNNNNKIPLISFPKIEDKFKSGTSSEKFMNNGLFIDYQIMQSALNSKNNVTNRDEIIMCPLDGCVFSAGALRGVAYKMLENGLKSRNESSVSLHANFIKGNKKKITTMQHHGLWLTNYNNQNNKDFKKPICSAYRPQSWSKLSAG